MESRSPGPRSRRLLLVVAASLLLLVVALASRPDGSQPHLNVGDEPGRVVLDAIFYLLLVGGFLGLLVSAWALWPNPDVERPRLERRRLSLSLATTTALLVVALVWWRSWGRVPWVRGGGPSNGVAGAQTPPFGGARSPLAGGADWIAIAITLTVLLAVAVVLWRAVHPRGHVKQPVRRPGTGLQQLLDDAIDDVLAEEDPRRAVLAAWSRLERLLDAHGAPRRLWETPFEYSARVSAELAMRAPTLNGMARLFEWARFSVNEVTPEMREHSLTALRAIREEARTTPRNRRFRGDPDGRAT